MTKVIFKKIKAENAHNVSAYFINGRIHSIEEGDWELDGNEITLYDSGVLTHHGVATKYDCNGETLENNGHEFVKQID